MKEIFCKTIIGFLFKKKKRKTKLLDLVFI